MSKKIISISGKHNIDKFNKTVSEREIVKEWDVDDIVYTHPTQRTMLNQYFLEGCCQNKKIMLREIKTKIQGYKSQDKDKDMFVDSSFVSLNHVIEILVSSKLKCNYCKENVYLLYKHVREPKQWTLDRLDNSLGHNEHNCVICCLTCNIQRKTLDDEKFRFTKQMKIVKKE